MKVTFQTQRLNINSTKKDFNSFPSFGQYYQMKPTVQPKKQKGLFAGLREVISDVAEDVKKLFTPQKPSEAKIQEAIERIKNIQIEKEKPLISIEEKLIEKLLNDLQKATGQRLQVRTTTGLTYAEVLQLRKEVEATVTVEIEHEELIKSLEKTFRRGKESFLPNRKNKPFESADLKDIVPEENPKSYKEELKRICRIYFDNTRIMDTNARDFFELSNNYFKSAAADLKEIYNIGSETKILEKIPKLGIIPKILRVGDQIRLTRCVKQDYDDITRDYVKSGFVPLVNKYNTQPDIIKEFVEQHNVKAFFNRSFTNKCLEKVEKARKDRAALSAKMLEKYAKSGKNICNVCNKIENTGIKDVVKKAIITLIV